MKTVQSNLPTARSPNRVAPRPQGIRPPGARGSIADTLRTLKMTNAVDKFKGINNLPPGSSGGVGNLMGVGGAGPPGGLPPTNPMTTNIVGGTNVSGLPVSRPASIGSFSPPPLNKPNVFNPGLVAPAPMQSQPLPAPAPIPPSNPMQSVNGGGLQAPGIQDFFRQMMQNNPQFLQGLFGNMGGGMGGGFGNMMV